MNPIWLDVSAQALDGYAELFPRDLSSYPTQPLPFSLWEEIKAQRREVTSLRPQSKLR